MASSWNRLLWQKVLAGGFKISSSCGKYLKWMVCLLVYDYYWYILTWVWEFQLREWHVDFNMQHRIAVFIHLVTKPLMSWLIQADILVVMRLSVNCICVGVSLQHRKDFHSDLLVIFVPDYILWHLRFKLKLVTSYSRQWCMWHILVASLIAFSLW